MLQVCCNFFKGSKYTGSNTQTHTVRVHLCACAKKKCRKLSEKKKFELEVKCDSHRSLSATSSTPQYFKKMLLCIAT